MKKCRVCHHPVPQSADQCECGYDFNSGTVNGLEPAAVASADRPALVTVVAVLMLVFGIISLIRLPSTLSDPVLQMLIARSSVPAAMVHASMVLGVLLSLVCAIGMLGGEDWARKLYVVQWLATFLISIAVVQHVSAVVPLAIFGIVCAILFSSKSNAYFTGNRLAL